METRESTHIVYVVTHKLNSIHAASNQCDIMIFDITYFKNGDIDDCDSYVDGDDDNDDGDNDNNGCETDSADHYDELMMIMIMVTVIIIKTIMIK